DSSHSAIEILQRHHLLAALGVGALDGVPHPASRLPAEAVEGFAQRQQEGAGKSLAAMAVARIGTIGASHEPGSPGRLTRRSAEASGLKCVLSWRISTGWSTPKPAGIESPCAILLYGALTRVY